MDVAKLRHLLSFELRTPLPHSISNKKLVLLLIEADDKHYIAQTKGDSGDWHHYLITLTGRYRLNKVQLEVLARGKGRCKLLRTDPTKGWYIISETHWAGE